MLSLGDHVTTITLVTTLGIPGGHSHTQWMTTGGYHLLTFSPYKLAPPANLQLKRKRKRMRRVEGYSPPILPF